MNVLVILTLVAAGLTLAWALGKLPGWAAVGVVCLWMLLVSMGTR